MSAPATQTTVLSASGAIAPDGDGRIVGIMVGSSTSLTLKIWDGPGAAGTVLLDTTAAITAPAHYPFRATFKNGGFVTFGGTGKITVSWERV